MPQAKSTRRGQAALYEKNSLIWLSPSPHEVAIAQAPEFLRNHVFTAKEIDDIRRYYGNSYTWAIRHLRLTETARRIRTTIS